MKRTDILAVSGIFASSIVLASFLTYETDHTATTTTTTVAAQPHKAQAVDMSMVIATPDMLGANAPGPAFLPGDPVFPANTDVTITVTNFDDATALAAGTEKYATATGVVGPLLVQALDPTNPNAAAPVQKLTALDPAKGVSHTFTIAKLGINVPIAPKSRETFTIHTTAAGKYEWQCYDPCGSDPLGWGGAMATAGYMKGSATVCGSCSTGAACC